MLHSILLFKARFPWTERTPAEKSYWSLPCFLFGLSTNFQYKKRLWDIKYRKIWKKISSAAESQMVQITVPITVPEVTPTGILSGADRIKREVVRRSSFMFYQIYMRWFALQNITQKLFWDIKVYGITYLLPMHPSRNIVGKVKLESLWASRPTIYRDVWTGKSIGPVYIHSPVAMFAGKFTFTPQVTETLNACFPVISMSRFKQFLKNAVYLIME